MIGKPGAGQGVAQGDRQPGDEGAAAPFGARQLFGLVGGLVAAAVLILVPPPEGLSPTAWRTAGVAALMAVWWITEALPVYATALVPLVLFPALGIADMRTAAAPYANPTIFLFMGGFMIALAMQRWGLHRRIALAILSVAGTGPQQLIAGLMAATVFLSMWISNTSATLMMLPIATSVLALIAGPGVPARDARNIAPATMLAVGFGATIGGVATLIGTPPNALLAGFMQETYGITVSFAAWMAVGVPLSLVLSVACWVLLCRLVFPVSRTPLAGAAQLIAAERTGLGPIGRGEIAVAIAFAVAATLWITQPILAPLLPALKITDAGIAMTVALVLFLVPVDLRRGVFVLDWTWANKLPWGLLVLFGGGLSLADAASASGLAAWIGQGLSGLSSVPAWMLVAIAVAAIVFLSEIASNTAAAATLLPLLAVAAVTLGQNPLLFCIAGALAASGGFMLPVATPPNAIVFGSGHVTMQQMVRAGFWLDLVWIVLVALAAIYLVPIAFDAPYGVVPDWAAPD
ncbi:MAG: DASS family sodium-coupled anion symporter [Rhodospirillaceae bacterium]|nr:DASS family sodium-coupled anion symporter [Rhodospirillaceae bacterium]